MPIPSQGEVGSAHRRRPRRHQWAVSQLEGKIQERYGLAKDQAKKDVDAWFKSLP
jgi:uncharacterized protein YjbJ (UPF0337 family)